MLYNTVRGDYMIISNLSEILGKKRIKIAQVIKDTGISRPTLTSLYYNNSSGINFDTLSKLCKYLDVKPNDILYYSEIDIVDISVKFGDFSISDETIDDQGNSAEVIDSADFKGAVKLENLDFNELTFEGYLKQDSYRDKEDFSLYLKFNIPKDAYNLFIDDTVQTYLEESIIGNILDAFDSVYGYAVISSISYSYLDNK